MTITEELQALREKIQRTYLGEVENLGAVTKEVEALQPRVQALSPEEYVPVHPILQEILAMIQKIIQEITEQQDKTSEEILLLKQKKTAAQAYLKAQNNQT